MFPPRKYKANQECSLFLVETNMYEDKACIENGVNVSPLPLRTIFGFSAYAFVFILCLWLIVYTVHLNGLSTSDVFGYAMYNLSSG